MGECDAFDRAAGGGMSQMQRLVVGDVPLISGLKIDLAQESAHYLRRVLRLGNGAKFIAMTGQGASWIAQLTEDGAVVLESVLTQTELPIAVTLAIALPKGSGFDEVVRQVTELGVSCIVPILSERTVLKPSENRLDRWRKIAQEAAEQSERQVVPTVLEPIQWMQFLKLERSGIKLLCWERGGDALEGLGVGEPVTIAIGPEGGWTPQEVAAAEAAGYGLLSLGPRILRSVTASVAVMAIVATHLEVNASIEIKKT
jgi:16S rRNA (uracil1498-N3)-methyltransferase